MSQRLQLTLSLIKPDICNIEYKTRRLQRIIVKKGFLIIRSKYLKLSVEEAKKFYHEHEERFFFKRLVYFMSSGPLWAHILAHPDGIKEWRALIGPTKVYRAIYEAPNSLRGMFGLTDTRNTVHGSDSEKNAREEIAFYFSDFKEKDWRLNEEHKFLERKNVYFNYRDRVHKIIDDNKER